MAHNRKGVRTTRTREDYELFKIGYPFYDPQDIQDVFLHVAPGSIVRPTTVIATVRFRLKQLQSNTSSSANQVELTTHLSGTIEKVGVNFVPMESGERLEFHLKSGILKGNIQICIFRQCDHIPRQQQFLSGNIIRQSTASVSNSQKFHNTCARCDKTLWIYYEEKEISITLEEFLKANNKTIRDKMQELQWAIILNEQFTPTVAIAKINDQELSLPYLAKATFLLNFQEIKQKRLREDTVIMKLRRVVCKHEKLIEGRCQYCMQQIREENVMQYETYLFQLDQTSNGRMLVKGTALAKQQEEFIQNVLQNEKTIMILDLDNTILHSNDMSELQLDTVMNLKDYYLIPKIQPYLQQKIRKDYIVVKMRPYFKHFLYLVNKHYEIYVYTKGTRIYAEEICNFVRAQYAGEQTSRIRTWNQQLVFLKYSKNFQPHRIISRNEDGNLESKSMQRILPSKKDYHIILDDRRDVWNHSPSWYFTQEYCYFNREARNTNKNPVKPLDQISHFMSNQNIDMPQIKNSLFQEFKIIKQNYAQKSNVYVSVISKSDYFLLFAAHALTKINRTFFQMRKKTKGLLNIDQKQQKNSTVWYIQHRLKHFFSKHRIRFFGAPSDPLGTIRRAQKLGTTVLTKQNQETATLVIRSRTFVQDMKKFQNPTENNLPAKIQYEFNQQLQIMKKFNEKKIAIVSQNWIQNCYELNYPFSFQKYIYPNPFEDDVQDVAGIQSYIQSVALHLKKDIEQKMQKEINKSE